MPNKLFRIKQEEAKAYSVLQGNVLGAVLYMLFVSNIPELENVNFATFVEDIAILATGQNQRTLNYSKLLERLLASEPETGKLDWTGLK